MPQSQLPDLNTIWLKWMDYVSSCLRNGEYLNAISGIYHVNAVFGADNRIEFNTAKYNELTRTSLRAICNSCKEEIVRDEIRFIDLLLPDIGQVITGEKYLKSWVCPKCHEINRVKNTEWIQDKFMSPRYLGVIPEPPEYKVGLASREFEWEVKKWIRLALDELSYALGEERREYVPVNDRMDMLDNGDND